MSISVGGAGPGWVAPWTAVQPTKPCHGDCSKCFKEATTNHKTWDMSLADSIFVKGHTFPEAGTHAVQHSHKYDHTTLITNGAVVLEVDGNFMGEFKAPNSVFIKANARHSFLTTEPNTTVYCIHNVSRSGTIEIN